MCEYKNACPVYGGGCKDPNIECDEKNRLERLKNEKCPIMVTQGGYTEKNCECDLPFWIRARIPKNITCVRQGQCIIALYSPDIRGKLCGRNLKLTPDEINSLAYTIIRIIKKNS